ncbi:MAG: PKD domain-containing protein [Candidatus Aminicenantes bacterium]|nr:PKD domain-containing protein [Candidatus Aminicenantes bacterium]
MKIKKIYMILISVVLFTVFASGQAVNLSKLPNTPSNHPWVLPYGDKVMVVWREEGGYSGTNSDTFYSIKSNGSWSRPKPAYDTREFSKNPHIGIGPDGVIHLVWADGLSSGREIYYGKFQNGAWQGSRQKIISSPYNSNWPRIGIYDNNVINVAWCSAQFSGTSEHWRTRNTWKSGNSWSKSVYLSKNATWNGDWDLAMHPDIFCQGSSAYVVWHEGSHSGKTIKFSEKESGGSWSDPVDVTPVGKMNSWPGIVVDSDNNVHVISSATGGKVNYTNRREGVWAEVKRINQERARRGFVTIDIDDNDTLHAVYQAGPYIYYNVANRLGVWGQEVKVSNGKEDMYPCISPDNNGYVHIVWCEADEGFDGDVFYTMLPAGEPPQVESPIAQFTHSPESGKPPLKVSFDASGSSDPDGTIVSYGWDFGDGSYGGGVKPNHTYTQKGIYTITLTVKDNDGISGIAQGYVYVTHPPVAVFTMNPSIGVAPVTVHFDASGSNDPDGTIAEYLWDFGDDTVGKGRTVSHRYEAADDYTVTLEVIDDYGAGGVASKLLRVLLIHPPVNIRSEFKINRNLFSIEYFFDVTWESNPLNLQNGIDVVSYRVYRRVKGAQAYTEPATVRGDVFHYWDRGLEQEDENRYEYTVAALDAQGNESLIEGLTQVAAPQKLQLPGKKHQ